MAMFTAHRTERGGFLVAFEGERMSMEEARARGLLEEQAPAPKARAAHKTARRKAKAQC